MGNEPQNTGRKKSAMNRFAKKGWDALQLGDWERAEDAYKKAILLAQQLGDEASRAVFCSYLGVTYQSKGLIDEAKEQLQTSADISREHGFAKIEAHANLLLGEQDRDFGHSDDAIHHFIDALDAAYNAQDDVGMELALGNLGRLYLERGWAEQASDWFLHALEARAVTPNKASWLGSLGLAMAELGQFEDALDYYVRAFAEAKTAGDDKTLAICKGSEGNVHFELKKYIDAIDCYSQALKFSQEAGDDRRVGIWLGNIGTAYIQLNDLDKAFDFCRQAVESARHSNDKQSEAAHLDSVGDCFMVQGNVEKALEHYEQALIISEDIDDRQGERIYLSNVGKVYERSGQLQPAFECFEKAIDLFDAQRSSIKADDLKTSFANRGQDLYRDMVRVCLSLDKRVEALEYVGRAKSRALLDLLSNSPIDISQLVEGTDESLSRLIRKESELRNQIAHFERLFWQGPPTSETGHRGGLAAPEDSQKLYAEWRDIVNQLRRRHPNYANLISASTMNFAEIGTLWTTEKNGNSGEFLLNRDTAILEFYWTDEYLVSAIVYHGLEEPVVNLISKAEEIESFSDDLNTFLEMSATEGWEVPLSLCKRLYRKLVAPLVSQLPGSIKSMIMVPHSSLYHLPFAALHDGEGFLCEKFSICNLPTTSLIRVLARGKQEVNAKDNANRYLVSAISDYSATRRDGVVFSSRLRSAAGLEDLSYTMEEAQTIFGIGNENSGQARLLTNEEVKQSLPELFSSYPVVHFAGHAVFNQDEPLASGLVLSDGSILTAAAILQTNVLHTTCGKLLVLSACQTGVNKVTAGGEILGLARALMYAGMPNLVLSLWEVADRSTASLMQDFHKNMMVSREGNQHQIADALKAAQVAAIKDGQPVHAWAPFIHLGID